MKETQIEYMVLIRSMWKSRGYYKQFAETIQTSNKSFFLFRLWITIDMKGSEFVFLSIYIQILNKARDKSV